MGLATGLAAWMLAGAGKSDLARIEPLQTEVAALRAPKTASAQAGPARAAELAATPIFVMTVGPGAVSEPLVRLDGVSVSKRRTAALLSFAGAAPEWLNLGETRNGVTLTAIIGSKAVLETILGARELALGEQTAGAAGSGGQSAETPPAGYRSPPPPAGAPGVG